MKILIVDDSRTMRMILLRSLRQAGFDGHDFTEAENGADALEKIQVEKPDFVFSDWNMPEMNGIELLKSLNESSIEVNFGFVTSECSNEMKLEATQNGAMFFITKPFTPDRLKEALLQHLG